MGKKDSVFILKIAIAVLIFILILVILFFIFGSSGTAPKSPAKDEKSVEASALNKDEPSDDFVKFFDVGEGDCALISSNGENMLIDSGTQESAKELCAKLRSAGVDDIDAVLLTHFHEDHMGGFPLVCDRFQISSLLLPDISSTDEKENAANIMECRNQISAAGGSSTTVKCGDGFEIGDFDISVIYYDKSQSDENNKSLITKADMLDVSFLLTGDCGSKIEKSMINQNLFLDCDVLKVAHHGSKGSTSSALLKKCMPDYAVISVGENNRYSHPSAETVARLIGIGSEIFRTDEDGDITFYIVNGRIKVITEE